MKLTPGSVQLAAWRKIARGEAFSIDPASGSSKLHTLRLGSCQTCLDPLLNPRPLELRQCREDVQLQLPGWRRAVDAFPQRDESHTKHLKFLDERDEVAEVATEPVQPPADQHIKLAPFRITD